MTLQDALLLGGLVIGWFVLNRFLLPRMGVAT